MKKKDKLQKLAITALSIFIAVTVIGVVPAVADDVSVTVTRDLPDTPVSPVEDICVTLNQSGFFFGAGSVTETLPDGFEFRPGSATGSDGFPVEQRYNEAKKELTIEFANETTVTYIVVAETAEVIADAEFSGTWRTFSLEGDITGNVTGDTRLTLAKPTPSPSPTATPPSGNGDGNGGGDGGGIPPTPPAGTPAYIDLSANPTDIPADGISTSTLTASVWDGEDWVLENLTVNFSTSRGNITESAFIMNGTATTILTAGMEEGVATITAEANLSGDIGIVTNTTDVNFTAPVATLTPPILTPTVTISPTPAATPSPTPSPTSKPLIPGFEAVFAIASLLSVAYLVMRRGGDNKSKN